jgi:hypothetical protein
LLRTRPESYRIPRCGEGFALASEPQSNRLKSEEPSNREAPTGAGEVVPGLVELEVAVPRLTPAMR